MQTHMAGKGKQNSQSRKSSQIWMTNREGTKMRKKFESIGEKF